MRVQGSTGRTAREFTFHCRVDAFDQGAFSILFCGEVLPYLKAHTGCLATGEGFGRDDTLNLELLAAEGVVAFRIELGVGQYGAYRCLPMRFGNQRGQRSAVVPRCLSCMLGQDELTAHIHHGEPLQPMLPGALWLAKMLYTADEVAARCALCQAGSVDGYRGRTSPPPWHAPYDRELYNQRNRIERCFSKLRQFRRFATQYEKSKTTFKAIVALACSWIILTLYVDTA